MTSPATEKRIALAAVAGAHGITGEVRLKLFVDTVASIKVHERLSNVPLRPADVREAAEKCISG